MDRLEEEMKKKSPIKSTWYDWLINYIVFSGITIMLNMKETVIEIKTY